MKLFWPYYLLRVGAVAWCLVGEPALAEEAARSRIAPILGHTAQVSSVTFSPEGDRLASASWDTTIKLWDVATGALLRTFEGHRSTVSSVAFSPDGSRILSGAGEPSSSARVGPFPTERDNSSDMRLWDVTTGALIRIFKGHANRVEAVAFSPDGKRILSGSLDRSLKLWSIETGTVLRTFVGHRGAVTSAAFSADGTRILSGSVDKTIKLWDAKTGGLVHTFEGDSATVSTDGKQILSRTSDSTIKLFDVATGALLRTLQVHSTEAWIAYSPDGAMFLSASNNSINLWDVATGTLVRTFDAHSSFVDSAVFSPNGAQIASGSDDNTVKLWNVALGTVTRTFATFEGNGGPINSVAFSPSGAVLLSGSGSMGRDSGMKLWDAATGVLVRTAEQHQEAVRSVAFSPDGERILSTSDRMKLWDARSGALLHTFDEDNLTVQTAMFSPDGTRILRAQDNVMQLREISTGSIVRSFASTGDHWVRSVAISPDGARVLSGGGEPPRASAPEIDRNADMKLWDAGSGALLRTFKGHTKPVSSVAFSPDGSRVLSGSLDGTIRLWDQHKDTPVRIYRGHLGAVTSVAFSPNGSQILSGSFDRTIKLWDIASGTAVRSFEGHAEVVNSVAFSRDGTRVLSGGDDQTLRIWSVETGRLIVTLFSGDNDEWLALTPEGFFAGSPNGGANLSVVRGLHATTIDQVRQSLFNPDLVREALAGDPSGEVRKATSIMSLDRVIDSGPAPQVEIAPHSLPFNTIGKDLVQLSARIIDRGKGIGRIEWRTNGVTVGVATAPTNAGSIYEVRQTLALDVGAKKIDVVAYNARNLLASLPARTTITYAGAGNQTKPKLHILAIGINAYSDRGWSPVDQPETLFFPALSLAIKDATAFGDSMKRAATGLYDQVKLTTLLDNDATRGKLSMAIDKLAVDIRPSDTFILFAAAHGKSEAGRFYLIPQDYDGGPDPTALAARAIDQTMLQDWLANRIKAKRAIVLLDTCESGALVGGHTHSRIDQPASEAALGRLHEATGRPILTAAAEGSPAFEGYEGHGVFTWSLLDALRHGDRNGNGIIELSELVAHVQDQVPKIAAKLNGIGRAAILVRGLTEGTQSARFGSRGEDFALARRLQ